MTIYRKGQKQFELNQSARLGENKLQLNKSAAMDVVNSVMNKNPKEVTREEWKELQNHTDFLLEDTSRQISYEAGLEGTTIKQHNIGNNFMNAVVSGMGIDDDVSIPISGDDLARGAAGKKALDALKNLK